MEGIETEGEALMAMDADADFVQGYYFAAPADILPAEDRSRDLFERLWTDFREVTLPEVAFHRREVSPYINAIGYAASLVGGEMRVLCGDVSWRDRGPVKR